MAMNKTYLQCPHCSKNYGTDELLTLISPPHGSIEKNGGDSYTLKASCSVRGSSPLLTLVDFFS